MTVFMDSPDKSRREHHSVSLKQGGRLLKVERINEHNIRGSSRREMLRIDANNTRSLEPVRDFAKEHIERLATIVIEHENVRMMTQRFQRDPTGVRDVGKR